VGVLEILNQIDLELSQLKQARTLLTDSQVRASKTSGKKRNLTPEGRRRIAEAVRRRWALQKKNQLLETAEGWVSESSSMGNLVYQSPHL
jgi:hypothetical protein